jgi:hypothetical protein
MGKGLWRLLALLPLLACGCTGTMGGSTGQVMNYDLGKIGSGEPVFTPVDDATHINGQPTGGHVKK